MAKQPWSKFFWDDWDSDPGLRLCSLAAQGLWMRMLCICARHEPKGYLAIQDQALTVDHIARLAGVSETDAASMIAELDRFGVFSRDRKGRIYSRRMVRDVKKSNEGRKNVIKRWSQPPENNDENHGPNRGANRNPSTKKPEARSQSKKKEETNVSSKKNGPPDDGLFGDDLPEQPPTPPPKAARATRLPTDWQPSADNCAYAAERGFSPEQTADLAEGFRDYWCAKSGKDATKTNWSLPWNTWVRNDVKFHGDPQGRRNGVQRNEQPSPHRYAGAGRDAWVGAESTILKVCGLRPGEAGRVEPGRADPQWPDNGPCLDGDWRSR